MVPFNCAVMTMINAIMHIDQEDAQAMVRAAVTFRHTVALFIGADPPHLQVS